MACRWDWLLHLYPSHLCSFSVAAVRAEPVSLMLHSREGPRNAPEDQLYIASRLHNERAAAFSMV